MVPDVMEAGGPACSLRMGASVKSIISCALPYGLLE